MSIESRITGLEKFKGAATISMDDGEIVIKIKLEGEAGEQKPKRVPVSYEKEFETWWSKYPRKINKAHACKKFSALTDDERAKAIETVDYWAKYYSKTEAQFIPHAATFLNQRRFNEVPPAEEQKAYIDTIIRAERTPEEKFYNQQHLGYHSHPLWSYYARAWNTNTIRRDESGMPIDFPTFANYFTNMQRGE